MTVSDISDIKAYSDASGTWRNYTTRAQLEQSADRSRYVDSVDRHLRELPKVTPLEALEANRRLIDELITKRRAVMQAAREEGATWRQIGKALGMTKQGASDWYKKALADEERRLVEASGLRKARKVLNG